MSIHILHLTDLHTYPRSGTLCELWDGAASAMAAAGLNRFNFIVVSGDLTPAAKPNEYGAVRELADELVKHLHQRDHRRIIFVPGNHDVDWAHTEENSKPVDLEVPLSTEELERLRYWRYEPEASPYRWDDRELKKHTLRRIERDCYNKRFQAFYEFVSDFYKNSMRDHDRPFELLKADEQHWSAHIFPEEQIAFYGFSSCKGNDCFWQGAAIDDGAIHNASAHARAHASGMTLCAVWHHGLSSVRGSADHLSVAELGRLRNAGFQIGFHGHTHHSEAQDLRALIKDRMVVIGTGSFGADSIHRPGGVCNEFAVVQISGKRLVSQVFARSDVHLGWTPRSARDVFDLRPAPPPPQSTEELSEVATHTRSVRIGGQLGIADVQVTFENAILNGKVVLASPHRAASNMHADKYAGPLAPGLPVKDEPIPHGRCYSLEGMGEHHERIVWNYSISNAFALSQADLSLLEPSSQPLQLPRDHDGLRHEVRLRTGSLTLEVEFHDVGVQPVVESAILKVFRRAADRPEEWMEDPTESRRLPAPVVKQARVQVTLQNPTLGSQYALFWKLAQPGLRAHPPVLELLQDLIALCREPQSLHSEVSRMFTDAVTDYVRVALDSGEHTDKPLPWVGHLWNQDAKKLLTCFGNFPKRSWCSVFTYGHGVVGHCFRFAGPASYARRIEQGTNDSLIFVPATRDDPFASPGSHHTWLLAVPILLYPKGPAVGVVGFSDFSLASNLDPICVRLRTLARLPPNEQVRREGSLLTQAVSTAFWATVSTLKAREFSPVLREEATRIFQEHWKWSENGGEQARKGPLP